MKRYLIIALLLVVALASNKTVNATPISWVLSPDAIAADPDNTTAFGISVTTGVNEINFVEGATQPEGIYGAGFTMSGTSAGLIFDADLYTWDSYNSTNGFFDAFIVTISTSSYYWDIVSLTDPITASADTWVWGGDDWGDGIQDHYTTAPSSTTDIVVATSIVPTTFYISLVLDTITADDHDVLFPSWGSFHVQPIPEPGTIALLGIGLAGLVGVGVRKRAKKNAA